jgi:ABC-type multidrug transport system ATPase subunit
MLTIEKLVKIYPGPVPALQGIDLELGEGLFGLLGQNGAGKSTLMKIVAGLLESTAGRVHLDGLDVVAHPRQVWDKLGYLPQDFGFYPHLTGRDMLAHLLRLKGIRAKGGIKKLSDALLERVNLSFAARRKVKEFSGGMRQRLGIAQALAGDPRLIIVDEPTAGLDPEERLRFYHLLSELAQDRLVLLSTHIVEDVAVLCPEFAIIRGGQIVLQTTPSKACEQLEGTIFEGWIEKDQLAQLEAERTVVQALLQEGRLKVRLHVKGGAAPEGFESAVPTLEDAYLTLMRTTAAPKAKESLSSGAAL